MDKAALLKEVNDIFIDVLDNDEIVLGYETQAKDVEDWDSLNHIQLVVAIEKHFQLKFTSLEIQSWQKVGDMLDTILLKQGK